MKALKQLLTKPSWTLQQLEEPLNMSADELMQWAEAGYLRLSIKFTAQPILFSRHSHVSNENLQHGIPYGEGYQFEESFQGWLQLRPYTVKRLNKYGRTTESRFMTSCSEWPYAQTIEGYKERIAADELVVLAEEAKDFLLRRQKKGDELKTVEHLMQNMPSCRVGLVREIQEAYARVCEERKRKPKSLEVYANLKQFHAENPSCSIIKEFMANRDICWEVSSANRTTQIQKWQRFQNCVSTLNAHFRAIF